MSEPAVLPTGSAHLPTGSAHAKAILVGEHAAVYGHPAIALPMTPLRTVAEVHHSPGPLRLSSGDRSFPVTQLPQRFASVGVATTAALDFFNLPAGDLEVAVRSGIPPQAGLGASAAAAHAIVEAIRAHAQLPLDDASRFELVQSAERVAHGSPSGIDACATRAREPFVFTGGIPAPLPLGAPVWFVVADTGVRASTDEAVAGVRRTVDADPARGSALLARLGDLTRGAVTDLEGGQLTTFGERMTAAQQILTELGVGHAMIDQLITAALGAGAAGAKLTGAGRGGCVIAAATDTGQADVIASAMTEAGAVAVWTVMVGTT